MHLSEAELAALAFGETLGSARQSAVHAASCPQCREKLEAMRRADRETAEALRLLDHAPPPVRFEAVVAVARTRVVRRRRLGLIAAGAALCVAGVAAALPISPVHRALVRVMARARGMPPAPAESQDSTRTHAGAGIAFGPEEELDVRFVRRQSGGRLRIVFAEAARVSLVPEGGTADLSLRRSQLVVDDGGAPVSFTLIVPRAVRRVRVQLEETVIFRKGPDGIVSSTPADSGGVFTLDLAPRATVPAPRAPRDAPRPPPTPDE